MSISKRTVITYGTFDLFHVGHVNLLERARALGDRLIVGVSSDEFNSLKGKRSVFPYEHRARIVGALECVDMVFPEHNWEQKRHDILTNEAKILVMGNDWENKFDELSSLCEVRYLSRTDGISTTELKSALKGWDTPTIEALKRSLDAVNSIVSQLRT